ncbi:MAG: acetoin utilization deacetylase AcuC-like enzyme [Planctomycetota bacterium]|jgi:acetoin utilization deacetylase AcuC-like enzyme
MSGTGYAWDASYLGHETLPLHPERPERVRRLDTRDVTLELPGLKRVKITPELGLAWVGRVHDPNYVEFVRGAWDRGTYALDKSRETLIRADSFDVALLSVAGTLAMTQEVASGNLSNGFAAVRPPGHHAGSNAARGFCIFNNVAACARYAQQLFDHKRVLIVDWDVHPGDGTAAIFYDDPDVHVVSVHQYGIFPLTVGNPDQHGRGEGEGATWNAVVEEGSNGAAYRSIFDKTVRDAAKACQPDIILVSCGFDAHAKDPVGGLKLDEEDYVGLTRVMMDLADEYCDGRLVSLLEGGYNPKAVHDSMIAHVQQLMAA